MTSENFWLGLVAVVFAVIAIVFVADPTFNGNIARV